MTGRVHALALLVATTALCGCATSANDDLFAEMFAPVSEAKIREVESKATAYPLGHEKNPVRVSMPVGERAYLERLRCADGNAPAFHRAGSVGEGPYGKIMDLYELQCLSGRPSSASVYMDMYHEHVEDRPIPGFTIKPR